MHTHTARVTLPLSEPNRGIPVPVFNTLFIFMETPHVPCPTADPAAHTHIFQSYGTMRRTFQAAAVLCYHRSATAFVSPSAALPSRAAAVRRSSTSRSYWLLPQQQQHQQGLNEQSRHAASSATALRAGDDSDAEAAMKKLLKEDFGANVAVDPKRVAVLFDFDGTIGDTETPAMEVAYWELAPYFPGAASKQLRGIQFACSSLTIYCGLELDNNERCLREGSLLRREWVGLSWWLCSISALQCT